MSQKEPVIVHGKGNISMQDEYMDFINYVFGFNGDSSDFYKLIPKLYKPEYDPCASSYVTTEDGRIKAAIGAFDHEIKVCGITLTDRGIGNVAVHPFRRSHGYMKILMNMAVDDMIKDGIDFSALGGRRQRYNYFSYEKNGSAFNFSINKQNFNHRIGAMPDSTLTVKEVKAEDIDALAEIAKLSDAQIYSPVRPEKKLFDILCSWQCKPYAVYRGTDFVGYFVKKDEHVYEAVCVNDADFLDMIASAFESLRMSSMRVTLPEFRQAYIKQLYTFSEGYNVELEKAFSVFNYKKVIDAFMRLKATYTKLPDGELTLFIHGRAKDEKLLISVKEGAISVSDTEKTPDAELSHIDAMNLLFAPFCPDRVSLPDFAKIWLPLPLYIYYADAV